MGETVTVKVLMDVDSAWNWAANGYKDAEWGELIPCADMLNGKHENQFCLTAWLAITSQTEITPEAAEMDTNIPE